MDRAKADSFTAYLEAKQRSRQSRQAPMGGTALSLLSILADAQDEQMPVTNLMATSGLPFGEFAEALKSLGEMGYLTLNGSPSNEVATLTKLGEEVSQLTRSK